MQKAKQGDFKPFNAARYRVGIVVARFNRDITDKLLASAEAELARYRVPTRNIKIARVAGSIELPVMLQRLAGANKFDCLVALGCVIRGATPHFDYVCKLASEGILRVMLDCHLPIGFGILTCESVAQARARVAGGASAVTAALQVSYALKQIKN